MPWRFLSPCRCTRRVTRTCTFMRGEGLVRERRAQPHDDGRRIFSLNRPSHSPGAVQRRIRPRYSRDTICFMLSRISDSDPQEGRLSNILWDLRIYDSSTIVQVRDASSGQDVRRMRTRGQLCTKPVRSILSRPTVNSSLLGASAVSNLLSALTWDHTRTIAL